MTRTRRALGLVVAAALTVGLAWASRARMTPYPSSDAMLRLAWSARPERLEECRSPTADELAALPRHMQQTQVCQGTTASYRLEVWIDDALVVDQLVHGGGLRRDRRLYVFRELAMPPGEASIDVRFTRVESPDTRSASPLRPEFIAPRLVLAQRVQLDPREVLLVSYDPEVRALRTRTRPAPGP